MGPGRLHDGRSADATEIKEDHVRGFMPVIVDQIITPFGRHNACSVWHGRPCRTTGRQAVLVLAVYQSRSLLSVIGMLASRGSLSSARRVS
jgi:hypothetical protein